MRSLSTFMLAAGLLCPGLMAQGAENTAVLPQVQVVRAAGWSQGDPVREGAAEFMILLEVARLTRTSTVGGLVGVGDRRGYFGPRAEAAMHAAVLRGVPVVKVAMSGRVAPAPHGLFIDGSGLSEEEACTVLSRCLEELGALPVVGEAATDQDLRGLRAQLLAYQQKFTLAAGTRLAVR